MRLSAILSLYIGRQFLVSFLGLFALFLLIILLFDSIELLRRAAGFPELGFAEIMEMALLKLPFLGQEAFPFAVLFGGMAAFWRLTRSNESVVTRAAGVSVWQFLLPVVFISFLLGVLQITILSPVASSMLTRFEQLQATKLEGHSSFLSISNSGLWLRQAGDRGQSVIHAKSVLPSERNVELRDVIVFLYEGQDTFIERVNAKSAVLEDGFWRLRNAWIYVPESPSKQVDNYWLATDLTAGRIQDSFAPPETLSFWALPPFISTLEKAGFSALRHRLYFHSLLAAPFLMCAMILVAAVFTLRQTRRGGTAFIVCGGVFSGFALYFFSEVVFALGLSDSIPVTLAAWTPSGIALLLGATILLHLEDG